MASLAVHLLSILIGVIFVFLGHIKLTPQFFPEYHNHVRNEFGKLNKEFPFYALTGWRPYAKNYRIAIGVIEMSAGSLLLLGGAFSQSLANIVLLFVITNMIVAFQKLNYSIEYTGTAIFIALLLILRMALASKSKAVRRVKSSKTSGEKKAE